VKEVSSQIQRESQFAGQQLIWFSSFYDLVNTYLNLSPFQLLRYLILLSHNSKTANSLKQELSGDHYAALMHSYITAISCTSQQLTSFVTYNALVLFWEGYLRAHKKTLANIQVIQLVGIGPQNCLVFIWVGMLVCGKGSLSCNDRKKSLITDGIHSSSKS